MKNSKSILFFSRSRELRLGLLTAVLGFALVSCHGPETIIVQKSAKNASKPGQYNPSESNQEDIRTLNYGETNEIESLDPLFAHNDATFRVIRLVYEGLTGLNDHGEVVPRLARSWDVSADSLTYTFHLRPGVYFQDNEVFSSGRGRLIKASDVEYALTRAAKKDLPGYAAHLFMDIHGYDTFYKEQHQIFDPDARIMKTIPGIQVVNDSTLKIVLDLPDRYLLYKLASPYAVVYPQEAVDYNVQGLNAKLGRQHLGLTVNPVGSGPFVYDHSEGDSIYVFVRNPHYWQSSGDSLLSPEKIRVYRFSSEGGLFRAFSTGVIDYIPRVGPALLQSLTNRDGALKPGYSSKFSLVGLPGRNRVELLFNPENDQGVSLSEATGLVERFHPQNYISSLPENTAELLYEKPAPTGSSGETAVQDTGRAIYIANTENKTQLHFLNSFIRTLRPVVKILRFQSLVISRPVTFYLREPENFYPEASFAKRDNLLLVLGYKRYALTRKGIAGIHYNNYSWWQDLTQVSIPETLASGGT